MKTIDTISRGGFGIVDKVELADGSIVARKTFNPAMQTHSGDELGKLRKRFIREVRFQSSISSKAICPVLDWDLESEAPWFLMPLASKTLAEEISECKARAEVPTKALADVLNALEELHHLGYVHRDIKPRNVLCIDDLWCLTDFGLILPPTGTTTRLTSADSAWGTPEYAAPEQTSEFHTVGPAADIYAFGCMLHDVFGNPPRIPYSRHTAPGAIGAIIERCTEQRPDRRFVSVPALRSALFGLLSAPTGLTASPDATSWVDRLQRNDQLTTQDFETLARILKTDGTLDDRYLIFSMLSEENLTYIHKLNEDLWNNISLEYCEWVDSTSFQWEFCDVLIHRLECIHALSDIAVQAAVIVTSAKLAASHNRWFVMQRVLKLCGPDLSENVATRVGIDIRAFEAQETFRRCADGIREPYEQYHPIIRDAIDPKKHHESDE